MKISCTDRLRVSITEQEMKQDGTNPAHRYIAKLHHGKLVLLPNFSGVKWSSYETKSGIIYRAFFARKNVSGLPFDYWVSRNKIVKYGMKEAVNSTQLNGKEISITLPKSETRPSRPLDPIAQARQMDLEQARQQGRQFEQFQQTGLLGIGQAQGVNYSPPGLGPLIIKPNEKPTQTALLGHCVNFILGLLFGIAAVSIYRLF